MVHITTRMEDSIFYPPISKTKSVKERLTFPQYYFLVWFRFFSSTSAGASISKKTFRFIVAAIGSLYLCACWGFFLYQTTDFIATQSKKSTKLFDTIAVLPDITRATRGPLVMTIFYQKSPAIFQLLKHLCHKVVGFEQQADLRRLKRLCWLAVPLSAALLALTFVPWFVMEGYRAYGAVAQTNMSNSTDVVKTPSKFWMETIMELIFGGYAYFLSDQIIVLLAVCCIIMRNYLLNIELELRSTELTKGESEKGSFLLIDHVAALYEEARVSWFRTIDLFMLLFGTAFGLDVLTMLGQVVSLVGVLGGNTFESQPQPFWRVALLMGISVWTVVFATVHIMASTIPLVMVYEQNARLREKLSDLTMQLLPVLRTTEGRSLEVSLRSLQKRMDGSHFCFHVVEIFFVTRSSVLTTFTLTLTFALIGKDILNK